MYVSKCCDSFIIYEGIGAICSNCNKTVMFIDKEPLTISLKFNDSVDNIINSESLNSYRKIAKRFSTDPTYEICSKQCPKCKSLCRYTRDPKDELLFICSNEKCRYVF